MMNPIGIEQYCFWLWLLVINVSLFSLMGIDKSRARKRKYRISERTLLLAGLFGGAAGGLVGMSYFRHKTKHRYFYVIYGLGMVIWLGIWFFLQYAN